MSIETMEKEADSATPQEVQVAMTAADPPVTAENQNSSAPTSQQTLSEEAQQLIQALFQALKANNVDRAEKMLIAKVVAANLQKEVGQARDESDDNITLLHSAVLCGNRALSVVKFLVEECFAPLDAVTMKTKQTPLMFAACKQGGANVGKFLLDKCIEADNCKDLLHLQDSLGANAFTLAVQASNEPLFFLMLQHDQSLVLFVLFFFVNWALCLLCV